MWEAVKILNRMILVLLVEDSLLLLDPAPWGLHHLGEVPVEWSVVPSFGDMFRAMPLQVPSQVATSCKGLHHPVPALFYVRLEALCSACPLQGT